MSDYKSAQLSSLIKSHYEKKMLVELNSVFAEEDLHSGESCLSWADNSW